MITIQKKTGPVADADFSLFPAGSPCLFFDIETTGLSREKNRIYLIGALLLTRNAADIPEMPDVPGTPDATDQSDMPAAPGMADAPAAPAGGQFFQWLAESEDEEILVLAAFLDFIRQLPKPAMLVHFNGARFDIPFFQTRCAKNGLDCQCFSQLPDMDLYQQIKAYKNLLGLPSCRQKSIENFLGIGREDQYDGGELIPVFHQYCRTHGKQEEALLLLHNEEDVNHMPRLTAVFSYIRFFKGGFLWSYCEEARYTDWEGQEKMELFAVYRTDDGRKIPSPLALRRNFSSLYKQKSASLAGQFWMSCRETEMTLRIPLVEGEMKYFFEDYKNYYYLPLEDQAVHKSVSQYVEPEYRKKATAKNCYTRIFGFFLPAAGTAFKPCFYEEYGSKQPWLRWETGETMCGLPAADFFRAYLEMLLGSC